ncbi:uncharacterized protein [Aegilops tauschii subsp. strangulata]
MLVPAPYQAPEKKAKKKSKEAKGGLRRKGASDIVSEDTETLSSHDEDEEGEEESNSPLKGGKKKRAASVDLDKKASKKGRISLTDDFETDADDVHEWRPRPKPLAGSPARDLPHRSSSSGNSLGPNMMESESPSPASPPLLRITPRCCPEGPFRVRERCGKPPRRRQGDTPTAENMGTDPMETGDRGHVQFGPQPNVILETHTAPESDEQPPSKEGGAPTPPATSVNLQAPDTLVGALQSAVIVEEHRTHTVVEKVRSAKSGLNEAYTSLLRVFEVAMQASANHAAEAFELRQKLEAKQADASEVETLKSVLAEAKKEAKEERAARLKHESRVEEVQQELKDAISKCEPLEHKISDQNSELAKALQSTQEARVEAQGALREIQEAKQIASGAFADLPRSVADAAEFFRAEEGAPLRSCAGRSTLRQSIQCPSAIS